MLSRHPRRVLYRRADYHSRSGEGVGPPHLPGTAESVSINFVASSWRTSAVWALETPPEFTRIGNCVEAINKLTGGGVNCSRLIG